MDQPLHTSIDIYWIVPHDLHNITFEAQEIHVDYGDCSDEWFNEST